MARPGFGTGARVRRPPSGEGVGRPRLRHPSAQPGPRGSAPTRRRGAEGRGRPRTPRLGGYRTAGRTDPRPGHQRDPRQSAGPAGAAARDVAGGDRRRSGDTGRCRAPVEEDRGELPAPDRPAPGRGPAPAAPRGRRPRRRSDAAEPGVRTARRPVRDHDRGAGDRPDRGQPPCTVPPPAGPLGADNLLLAAGDPGRTPRTGGGHGSPTGSRPPRLASRPGRDGARRGRRRGTRRLRRPRTGPRWPHRGGGVPRTRRDPDTGSGPPRTAHAHGSLRQTRRRRAPRRAAAVGGGRGGSGGRSAHGPGRTPARPDRAGAATHARGGSDPSRRGPAQGTVRSCPDARDLPGGAGVGRDGRRSDRREQFLRGCRSRAQRACRSRTAARGRRVARRLADAGHERVRGGGADARRGTAHDQRTGRRGGPA